MELVGLLFEIRAGSSQRYFGCQQNLGQLVNDGFRPPFNTRPPHIECKSLIVINRQSEELEYLAVAEAFVSTGRLSECDLPHGGFWPVRQANASLTIVPDSNSWGQLDLGLD